MDALESGEVPTEDSLYEIAPFVQKIFDNLVKPKRNDIYDFIKENIDVKLD